MNGALSLTALFALTIAAAEAAQAQTFTILHDFTNGGDGGFPSAGLTIDAAGNLYGTTRIGGSHGNGTVFKLKRAGLGWSLTPLHSFAGGDDGAAPEGGVTIAADGTLYGTTFYGGSGRCGGTGCGTVFHLKPPMTAPKTALILWSETVLYRFTGGSDGSFPQGDLTFDGSGNLFGTTIAGGDSSDGVVYKLTQSNGAWTETVVFAGKADNNGSNLNGGVVFDSAGNLYGVCQFNDPGVDGTAYQLSPAGSGWTEQTIHHFSLSGDNGLQPIGGLLVDGSGNLFGTTLYGGSYPSGGTVFELTPISGGWTYNTIYSFLTGDGGPVAKLIMDAVGSLYGTTLNGGANGSGSVFKLTPSNGGWTFTTLYDFCAGGYPCIDGANPMSNVVFDRAGNLYGTTYQGGANGYGIVWKITP